MSSCQVVSSQGWACPSAPGIPSWYMILVYPAMAHIPHGSPPWPRCSILLPPQLPGGQGYSKTPHFPMHIPGQWCGCCIPHCPVTNPLGITQPGKDVPAPQGDALYTQRGCSAPPRGCSSPPGCSSPTRAHPPAPCAWSRMSRPGAVTAGLWHPWASLHRPSLQASLRHRMTKGSSQGQGQAPHSSRRALLQRRDRGGEGRGWEVASQTHICSPWSSPAALMLLLQSWRWFGTCGV